MPYLTGFFLVSAGMLFGYLFRYRDQSGDSAVSESLASENEEIRTSLKIAHDSNQELVERFERQKGQMTLIQQLSDEWSANRQQSEHERKQLVEEVAVKTQQLETLAAELEQEPFKQEPFEQEPFEQEPFEQEQKAAQQKTPSDEGETVSALDRGLQMRVDNQELTIQRWRIKHDDVVQQLADSSDELARVSDELEVAERQSGELTTQLEELQTTCQRISELENLVRSRDTQESPVVEENGRLREQFASTLQLHHELEKQLEVVLDEKQIVQVRSEQLEDDNQSLRADLKASVVSEETLLREQTNVLAELENLRCLVDSNATVISFTEAMDQRRREAVDYDHEYDGPMSLQGARGDVFTEAPKRIDDLKKISGIAEVLEARLNDFGIYTFKQIMGWSSESVEEFSRLFAFKDRIERDNWVGQAKRLYEQKDEQRQNSAA